MHKSQAFGGHQNNDSIESNKPETKQKNGGIEGGAAKQIFEKRKQGFHY